MKRIKFFVLVVLFFSSFVFAQDKFITVVSPNGGEKLHPNLRYGISWTAKNINRVNIYYSTENIAGWKLIATNIEAALGNYGWKIPNFPNTKIKIKIEATGNKNIYDVSDNFANITQSNKIKLKKNLNGITAQTLRIMPLGNSITYDSRVDDNRPVEDRFGYRLYLYDSLANNGYDFDFVGSEHAGSNYLPAGYDANAGFPGIRDNELYVLLKTGRRYQPAKGIDEQITNGPYLDYYPADIILLHIGTNGNNEADGTSPNDVEDILNEIDRYEDSTGTHIKVFLALIINRSPNESFVTDFNNNVKAMALDRINNAANPAYPDDIVIVDMEHIPGFDYTIDQWGTIGDGVAGDMNDLYHPNDKGYAKMAITWFNAIKSSIGVPPVITNQPVSRGLFVGDTATFSITMTDTVGVNYQWYKNDAIIPGATTATLTLPNVTLADNNSVFRCVAQNLAGTAISNYATLYVTDQNEKVTGGSIVRYTFNEGTGTQINDLSGFGSSLNLTINNPSSVEWVPYGLKINSPTAISSGVSATKIIDECKTTNEITIEAWVKPQSASQTGPARIVSLSANSSERNFTLGQDGNAYQVRLRTTGTNLNGIPAINTNYDIVSDITHVVYTRNEYGAVKIYVNGTEDASFTLNGDFSNWGSAYELGIGNEFVDARPWLGTIYDISIFGRALSAKEVQHNYNYGIEGLTNLSPPANLQIVNNQIGTVTLNWIDKSDSEDGFKIERSEDIDSNYNLLTVVSANTQTYTDNSVEEGRLYFYRIKAYNQQIESLYSNVDTVITASNPINSPTTLNGDTNLINTVLLTWNDNSDNEKGFVIERQITSTENEFSKLDTVEANVTSYADTNLSVSGQYKYRVYAYNLATQSNYSPVLTIDVIVSVDDGTSLPNDFSLSQNYPNPFNPSTIIKFAIPVESNVRLILYNALGEKVRELVNGVYSPGNYSVNFNGTGLSSGIYYYSLSAESLIGNKQFRQVRKLILLQ